MLFIGAGFFGMLLMVPSELEYVVNEDINVPASEVFKGINDPEDMVKWMTGLKSVKQVKGDGPGVHSEYDLFYPQDMIMHRTTNVYDLDSRIVNNGEVKDFFNRIDDYTIKALDSSKTRISWKVKMKSLNMGSRMILKAEDTHKNNTAENLTALKTYLEK